MSEMLERVRQAIDDIPGYFVRYNKGNRPGEFYEVVQDNADAHGGLVSDETLVVMERLPDREAAEDRAELLASEHRARAAIEAMREANGAMVSAGCRAPWVESIAGVYGIYVAMIDEALTDGVHK